MDVQAYRAAFLSAIPSQNIGVPERQFIYMPRTHSRALHPDHGLVRGIRGAGKSVWWSVLQSEYFNVILSVLFPSNRTHVRVWVHPGFGEDPDPGKYPGRDTLELLLKTHEPRLIWRTVVLLNVIAFPPGLEDWMQRVQWVSQNPEPIERMLYAADQQLLAKQSLCLVVFDALDRTATTWDDRARLLDGLLQNLLDFRACRAIRLKAFVRPDMLVGPEIGRFPDASKVLSSAVDLLWPRTQLFGLLWQYLINAPSGGDSFSALCREQFGQSLSWSGVGWLASEQMNTDETLQRRLFHTLAGEWMGTNKRRGYPYTWLPNHLADAHEQVSPRSFLSALREAADESAERYRDHSVALHYEAIKRGVQKASQIRVQEVAEDFPWIREVMAPLHDLTVPCELTNIDERWVSDNLQTRLGAQLRGVLPQRSGEFSPGLCEQLVAAGIFTRMSDRRINLPDVYRVGFGLRRMGGVTPLR